MGAPVKLRYSGSAAPTKEQFLPRAGLYNVRGFRFPGHGSSGRPITKVLKPVHRFGQFTLGLTAGVAELDLPGQDANRRMTPDCHLRDGESFGRISVSQKSVGHL